MSTPRPADTRSVGERLAPGVAPDAASGAGHPLSSAVQPPAVDCLAPVEAANLAARLPGRGTRPSAFFAGLARADGHLAEVERLRAERDHYLADRDAWMKQALAERAAHRATGAELDRLRDEYAALDMRALELEGELESVRGIERMAWG